MPILLLRVNTIISSGDEPTFGVLSIDKDTAWHTLELIGHAKRTQALHSSFSFIKLAECPVIWIKLDALKSCTSLSKEDCDRIGQEIDDLGFAWISEENRVSLLSDNSGRYEQTEGEYTCVFDDGISYGLEYLESEPEVWDTSILNESLWYRLASGEKNCVTTADR